MPTALIYLLTHTDLEGFPIIPSLHSLELGGSGTRDLVAIHHTLTCSPGLESIVIEGHHDAFDQGPAIAHLGVVPMPHLHLLRITLTYHLNSAHYVLDVLNMLPDPSTHLEVVIGRAAWTTIDNEAVLARLGRFWHCRTGYDEAAWPPPGVLQLKDLCKIFVVFGQ
jgi:hypothetical protein